MTAEEMRERIIAILKREFPHRKDLSGIPHDGDLIRILNLDSHALLNVILMLESEFGVHLDEGALQIRDIRSLAALTRTIQRALIDSGRAPSE
jgi:acyl carrier protein